MSAADELGALVELSLEPLTEAHLAGTVYIVKGNPEVIASSYPQEAERFYNEIAEYVRTLGFEPKFHSGAPYTQPRQAALWIGHSMGVDRLRFARPPTRTVALGAPDDWAINHPKDDPRVGKPASRYHYILTAEMKEAIARELKEFSASQAAVR